MVVASTNADDTVRAVAVRELYSKLAAGDLPETELVSHSMYYVRSHLILPTCRYPSSPLSLFVYKTLVLQSWKLCMPNPQSF